jgi:hypothetical protein
MRDDDDDDGHEDPTTTTTTVMVTKRVTFARANHEGRQASN